MTFHQQSLTLDESLNVLPKLFLTKLEWIYASSKSLVFHACTNILEKGGLKCQSKQFSIFFLHFFLLNGTKLGTVGFNDIKKVTKSTVCPTNNIYRHIGLFVTSKKICSLSSYNSNISLDFPFPWYLSHNSISFSFWILCC